jgi:type IV secretory pathway VirJ component
MAGTGFQFSRAGAGRGRASAALLAALALAAAAPIGRSRADTELPLVRVPAAPGDAPLVLLLTGDGDWAAFVRDLANGVAARGAPVLGFKSRSYLSQARTPEESAAALEAAVTAQLTAWNRSKLVIIGYSRGADLAPFVVNRWPQELRSAVRQIVLIGLGERASFEFHLEDLVRDVTRPNDVPTRPELEKLAGIPLVCIRGADEKGSGCLAPLPGMRTVVHGGGHRATTTDGTIDIVLDELALEQ